LLESRRSRFIADGALRQRRLGRAQIGLLHVPSFVRAIQPEFEASITSFRPFYEIAYLEKQNLRLA
jgi:hypothetical protein